MKIIISHDIDHLTVSEHLFKDLIIPKAIARYHIELITGKISMKEFFMRFGDIISNKWNNIDALHKYNQSKNIPSSFFIGVRNGLGLSYAAAASKFWIDKMHKHNCEVNIHGIAFESAIDIEQEHDEFKAFSLKQKNGIRMHYVRLQEDTLQNLANAGYYFDSSEFAFKNPYKVNSMWEFPFQIMDGWIIENGKRWQTRTLQQSKDDTLRLIEKAEQANLSHLGIIFHDRYFTKSFATWFDWYVWLTEYLSQNEFSFSNFDSAVNALNRIEETK
jgi:hypothetical protein